MHFKASLHCYCSNKCALTLGAVNIYTVHLENMGINIPTAVISEVSLKKIL